MKYSIAISVILVSTIAIIFYSCQKELSCEGPECRGIYDDGKAVYSFFQANGNCTNAIVKGSYFKAVALNDSNYITVEVYVSKKGNYDISTDTVNGFYFIAKGSFADTTVQSVVLKGNGKATKAGNYTFITNKISGCNINIRVDTAPNIEKYYYDVTIDGIRYQRTVRDNIKNKNFFNPNSQVALLARITNGELVRHNDNSVSDEGLGIQKAFINLADVTIVGLNNYFITGTYLFSPPNSAENITISWINGTDPAYSWGSYMLPGTQNGSNFTITNIETYTDAQGRPIAKVRAIFNCILYNRLGQFKVLTNGKFYGEFANILR